jgi:hypothetical protein
MATKQAKKNTTPVEKKQELAAPKNEALANANLLDMVMQDEGAGSEDVTTKDLSIPRITILQSGSPQVKKREATYVDGAEEGMIIDSVSLDLFDGEAGITIIPCAYRRTNLEWIPREKGGGLAGDHGSDDAILAKCTKNEKGQLINSAGNLIAPTAEYFVLLVDKENGTARPFVLSMASTQLKNSRKWNTTQNMLRVTNPHTGQQICPPMFYKSYNFTTVPETNDAGSWFGWKIETGEDVLSLKNGTDIYLMARALRQSVKEGAVVASKAGDDQHHKPSESDDSPM